MDTTVTLELPTNIYDQLQALADEEQIEPVEVMNKLITAAHQQHGWLHELNELRDLIRREGGLRVGVTKEEIVEQMRQTRYEIFETEYAHLYR